MRSPSAPAPKPAKTTEWMAPMRAQASISTMASGIVGSDSVTRSPRPMPSARSPRATRCTSRSRWP